jgi:hypothetical protein
MHPHLFSILKYRLQHSAVFSAGARNYNPNSYSFGRNLARKTPLSQTKRHRMFLGMLHPPTGTTLWYNIYTLSTISFEDFIEFVQV